MSVSPPYRSAFNYLYPLLLLLGAYWSYNAYDRYRLRSYGTDYNPVRQRLGLPLVGADWRPVYSADAVDFVNPNQQAVHARKRVVASWRGPTEEADLVTLPAGRGTLNMVFLGSIKTSSATLYGAGKTTRMPYVQALDTLRRYRIIR